MYLLVIFKDNFQEVMHVLILVTQMITSDPL